MPYALSNGIKLYYEEVGNGFPIIFVHEFGSDLREWEQQLRYFSRDYRCVAFNARGYTPSEVSENPEDYGYEFSVDDILNLMKNLKINQAHIVGLSMGAYASLIFGIKYSEMVASLVIAGVGSGAMPKDRKSFINMANDLADIFEKEGSAQAAKIIGNSGSRLQLLRKDPRAYKKFLDHLEEHSATGSSLTMRQYQALRPSLIDFEEEFIKMDIPTLLMVGDEDELCLDINIYLKRKIKTSGLWIYPQTGHAINLEEPSQFNSVISMFLSKVERGSWKERLPESFKDINNN